MDEVFKIQERFPLLIPHSNFRFWNGTVFFEGEEISASISTPLFPSLKNFSFVCPSTFQSRMKNVLSQHEMQRKVDKKNDSLLQLLQYLKSLKVNVENNFGYCCKSVDGSITKRDYYFYNQILNELKELESNSIVKCSRDLSEVTLRTVDIRGVEHRFVVGLTLDYPTDKPTIKDIDLPEIALVSLSQAKTVIEMFNSFRTVVDSFQEFWNAYENLTKNTWLIDPEHPRLRDTHCRINIGENVSMLITFDPQDVNTCPDIKFLGPENAVGPFLDSLESKLKTEGWDEELSVHDNLLNLLDLTHFPQPDVDTDTSMRQDECSICFLMRLENQTLPTKVCNNVKCSAFFHIPCLAQWFQAVPTNEISFNLISGDCPCCGERILCPIKIS